jgi:hypothetical protein
MKAKVELVFEDQTKNKKVEIEVSDKTKGTKVLDAIDKAVNKQFEKEDWQRWNLLGITDTLADPPPASRPRPKTKKASKRK